MRTGMRSYIVVECNPTYGCSETLKRSYENVTESNETLRNIQHSKKVVPCQFSRNLECHWQLQFSQLINVNF